MALNIFGFGTDPAAKAKPYFDKAAETERGYLDPYAGFGTRIGGQLESQFGQMAKDPASVLDALMKGYQPSKYYEMMHDRLSQAASNTAAAGGMRGSPQEQTTQQGITEGLLSKDMQDYLSKVLGLQTQGLAGEQGLFGTGFKAAGRLAGDLGNIFGTEGQLAFQGEREKQQRGQDLLSALMSGVGGIAGLPTQGGSTIGGDLFSHFFGE